MMFPSDIRTLQVLGQGGRQAKACKGVCSRAEHRRPLLRGHEPVRMHQLAGPHPYRRRTCTAIRL